MCCDFEAIESRITCNSATDTNLCGRGAQRDTTAALCATNVAPLNDQRRKTIPLDEMKGKGEGRKREEGRERGTREAEQGGENEGGRGGEDGE